MARLASAIVHIEEFQGRSSNATEEADLAHPAAVENGGPYMLHWILRLAGLHCLSGCGISCQEEVKRNRNAFATQFFERRWTLAEFSMFGVKGIKDTCGTGKGLRHMCKMT